MYLCLKLRAADTLNFGATSIGVRVEVEGVGLVELLEFLKSLGQGLPLALAHPHLRDDRVDLDAVVNQGNLLGRVLLLDGVEIDLVGLYDCFLLLLFHFFFSV